MQTSHRRFIKENNLIKMIAKDGAATLSNRYQPNLGLCHHSVAKALAATGLYEIFTGPDGQRMIRKYYPVKPAGFVLA